MSALIPPALLRDLFGGVGGPKERHRELLEEIEEALKSQRNDEGQSDASAAAAAAPAAAATAAAADDDKRLQLAALAAARVAALTEEEDAAFLSSSSSTSRLFLLEPLVLGVRLEAGAVARLLECCRRCRRRRRRRRRRREGEEEEEEGGESSSHLLLLEEAALAASKRLAPPSAKEQQEEEAPEPDGASSFSPSSSSLVRWSQENGARLSFAAKTWKRRKSKQDPADPSLLLLRGAAATMDVPVGAELARIPFENLVHSRMIASTDAGKAILSLGLHEEEALLAFTLLDAADDDSPRAPLWESLREGAGEGGALLRTALNATEAEVALLDERTPAFKIAARAAKHAAAAAEAAAPLLSSLSRAFGAQVRPELFPGVSSFSEGAYRWAMAVWYAYAIELAIDDDEESGGGDGNGNGGAGNGNGSSRKKKGASTTTPCLCPPLFLLNHSPYPHCVSYRLEEEEEAEEEEEEEAGEREKKTKNRFLVARACRAAKEGEQLFLSYGRLLSSSAHSLCYYGFVVPASEDPGAALEVDLQDGLKEKVPPPAGLETRHFLRAATTAGDENIPPATAAALSAAKEIALLSAKEERGRPLSAEEVLGGAVAAARAALAATAARAEEAIKGENSSSFSASPFVLAILEYARSGVELADRVAASALGREEKVL